MSHFSLKRKSTIEIRDNTIVDRTIHAKVDPTDAIYRQLKVPFVHFNRMLFDGSLPDCVLAVGEFPFGHRYYGLLRLPNAHPRFLRGARSSPGTCRLRIFWYGSTRRSRGPFLVGALISRWTPGEVLPPACSAVLRQEADEALPSSRVIPGSA